MILSTDREGGVAVSIRLFGLNLRCATKLGIPVTCFIFMGDGFVDIMGEGLEAPIGVWFRTVNPVGRPLSLGVKEIASNVFWSASSSASSSSGLCGEAEGE